VFEAMDAAEVEAVAVDDDGTLNTNRALIAAQAERRRLPLVCGFREFVHAGCLLSYAVDYRDNARRAAGYVDKILKGAKPGEFAVPAADQVRPAHQHEDGQEARAHSACDRHDPCERGD
jgi:putative tryptophan/tyrosine transport system substrate-binding protein